MHVAHQSPCGKTLDSKKPHCPCPSTNLSALIGLFHVEWCLGCACMQQQEHEEAEAFGRPLFFSLFFEGGAQANGGARNKLTELFDNKDRSTYGFYFVAAVL